MPLPWKNLQSIPLAKAIVEEAERLELQLYPVEDFLAIPGRGIEAILNNKKYLAGNLNLMTENKIPIGNLAAKANSLAEEGKTPLFFADQDKILGIIAVADVVKATSKAALDSFAKMGIEAIMLTGDNKKTAEAIRRQLNIDRTIAELMPQDKEREIRNIQESGRKWP